MLKQFNSFVQTSPFNSHTDAKQIFAPYLKAQGSDHVLKPANHCEGVHIQKRLICKGSPGSLIRLKNLNQMFKGLISSLP